MKRTVLTSRTDLRNWIDTALGADGDEAMVAAVTEYVQNRPDRPNWGENWSEYLEGLDLWHIVTGLQL